MTEQYTLPPYPPQSLEYGLAVVTTAGNYLQTGVNSLAASDDPTIAVEIKTDPLGFDSPVTTYDKNTEQLIGRLYNGTRVRIKGEENVNQWPDGQTPELDVHADPIDGTGLFVDYVQKLIEWTQLPEEDRPPRPVCGSMVSVGGLRPESNEPKWGAIAAPFMLSSGIICWAAGGDRPVVRIEPDGQYELPHANTLMAPETGGAVLVASDSAERIFGAALRAAGYRTNRP